MRSILSEIKFYFLKGNVSFKSGSRLGQVKLEQLLGKHKTFFNDFRGHHP